MDEIKAKLTQCYGALSSFQAQLHSIYGVVEEIRGEFQLLNGAFNDLEELLREAIKK